MSMDVLTREYRTPTPIRLSVTTGAGSVQVDAVDGDRTVVTITPAAGHSDARQEALAGAVVEQRGDQIVVEVPRRSVGFLGRGSDLAISVLVPPGSTAEVFTDSADLRTTGLLGAVHAKSGSGDLVIEHAGEVSTHTGSGNTAVTRADGPVQVRSGSGDVAVHAAAGGCSVSTGSGDIRVERAEGPVQINTGSGDVTVDDAGSNVATLPIKLWPGMKIGQLCFFRLSSPSEHPYGSSVYGSRYQGQRGPTPSRSWVNFHRTTT